MIAGVVVTVSTPGAVAAVVARPGAVHVMTAIRGQEPADPNLAYEFAGHITPGTWCYRAFASGYGAATEIELESIEARHALASYLVQETSGREGNA